MAHSFFECAYVLVVSQRKISEAWVGVEFGDWVLDQRCDLLGDLFSGLNDRFADAASRLYGERGGCDFMKVSINEPR